MEILQQSMCTSRGSRLNKPWGITTDAGQRAIKSHRSIKLRKFRSLLAISHTPHLLNYYYVDSPGLACVLIDSEGLFFSSTSIHRICGNAKSFLQQESVFHLSEYFTYSSEILTAFYSD